MTNEYSIVTKDSDFQFGLTRDGLTSLEVAFGCRQYKILFYMIRQMNPKTNVFCETIKEIRQAVKVGESTVLNGLQWIWQNDMARPVRSGAWMVNPYMVVDGQYSVDIQSLCSIFDSLKKYEPAEN